MYKYPFITFLSGFVTMSVELTAARIIAPIIGSSIFTWTSVIGIILLGISLGNYLGGRLADKNPNDKIISRLLIAAALFIALIPLLSSTITPIVFWPIGLMLKIVIISAILFLAPAIFLGTIYPAALKLYLPRIENVGRSAGLLSGLTALGSILGTFATGFFFTGFLGSIASLYLLSLIFIFSSLLFDKYFNKYFLLGLLIIAGLFFLNNLVDKKVGDLLLDEESDYYKIQVLDRKINNRPARLLLLDLDSHSIESLNGKKLGNYQETASIFTAFKGDLDDILVIGGGSYNLPKDFNRLYGADVSVVEIDPEVTRAAEEFFDLQSYEIETINTDGRLYLTTNNKNFDLIFNDAFSSFISVPWYLTTLEANESAKKHLKPGGVYVANIISALSGDSAKFFESFNKTFSQTFSNYYILHFNKPRGKTQNIFFVGINSNTAIDENKLTKAILELAKESEDRLTLGYAKTPRPNTEAIILRDDFAPVEILTIPLINSYIGPHTQWLYSIKNG